MEQQAQEYLKYYESFFPFNTWYQWLNHSPVAGGTDFTNREFAFSINTGQDSDVYIRWQSFANAPEFKKKVMMLAPTRFEIGAVHTRPPIEHKRVPKDRMKPVAKELVFDIDMSDYDDYRTCCSGKQVCPKCWQFITVAIEVLSLIFAEDFGYKHVLWAFSGRRGAHAWVCDERARNLDDQQRRDLLEYITVQPRTVQRPFHPMVKRSFDLCANRFRSVVLANQTPFQTPEQIDMLMDRLKEVGQDYTAKLRAKFAADPDMTSADRWRELDNVAVEMKLPAARADALLRAKQNLVLEFLYPKLDANVSKMRGHLLKSPFCVHPDTGNVCVPLAPESFQEFDPTSVPTIQGLLNEKRTAGGSGRGMLEPALRTFRQFVAQLNRAEKRQAESMEF